MLIGIRHKIDAGYKLFAGLHSILMVLLNWNKIIFLRMMDHLFQPTLWDTFLKRMPIYLTYPRFLYRLGWGWDAPDEVLLIFWLGRSIIFRVYLNLFPASTIHKTNCFCPMFSWFWNAKGLGNTLDKIEIVSQHKYHWEARTWRRRERDDEGSWLKHPLATCKMIFCERVSDEWPNWHRTP